MLISVRMVSHATPIHFFLVGAFCQQIIIVFQNCLQIEILPVPSVLLQSPLEKECPWSYHESLCRPGRRKVGEDFSHPSWRWFSWFKNMATLTFLRHISILSSQTRNHMLLASCYNMHSSCRGAQPHLGYQWPPGSFQFFCWWSPEFTFTCQDLKWY